MGGRGTAAAALAALFLLIGQACAQDDQAAAQVAPELTLSGVKVVLKVDGSPTTLTANYPQKVLSNPQVPASGSLEVTFSVQKGGLAFKPQQAMLVLTHKGTGLSAYAVAKTKGNSYSAGVTPAAVEKQIGKVPGEYEVTLLAGDSNASKSVKYVLGTAELLISAPAGAVPAVRTSSVQPTNNVKPEIAHVFRLPENRPPAVISLAFTGLAFVPLLAVLGYVTVGIGANVKGMATAPAAALLFHGGIATMLGLYLLFWLKLNLAQTLPLALLIGLFIAATGYQTLAGLYGKVGTNSRIDAVKPTAPPVRPHGRCKNRTLLQQLP